MAQSNEAVMAELAVLKKKVADIEVKLESMTLLNAANHAATVDKVLTGTKDLLTQHVAPAKAKKATPTAAPTEEKKEGEAADAAGEAPAAESKATKEKEKAKHPKYSKLAESAWKQKKTGAPHEKIGAFLVAMRNHYPADLTQVIGEGVDAEVMGLDEYKAYKAEKHSPNDYAARYVQYLWTHLAKTGRVDEVSKRVVALFDKESAVMSGKKIEQVVTEGQTAVEAQAAAVLNKAS